MMSVWPSGWVCHAVRAPGSKVTLAACTNAGSGACNSGSIRTVPLNQSAEPFADACEPALLISIVVSLTRELTSQRASSRLAVDEFREMLGIPFALHFNS